MDPYPHVQVYLEKRRESIKRFNVSWLAGVVAHLTRQEINDHQLPPFVSSLLFVACAGFYLSRDLFHGVICIRLILSWAFRPNVGGCGKEGKATEGKLPLIS